MGSIFSSRWGGSWNVQPTAVSMAKCARDDRKADRWRTPSRHTRAPQAERALAIGASGRKFGEVRAYPRLPACEVFEETGLTVTQILDDPERISQINQGDREAECLRPFAAYQTLHGTFPSMGVYFRCHADGELLTQGDGAANARWVSIHELKRLVAEESDSFLTFELTGIRQWLQFHSSEMESGSHAE